MSVKDLVSGDARRELAHFLVTRRAALSPDDVGLVSGRRRRVPGLRREEVAVLAGVSETWYARLEQGQPINVSAALLKSIAGALRLDDHERNYFFILAGAAPGAGWHNEAALPSTLRDVLDALRFAPAVVYGPRWDVLMWNRAYAAVFGDLEHASELERNVLHQILLQPSRRRLFPEWEPIARRVVEQFRVSAARKAGDPAFAELIAYLHERSSEFRAWWAEHHVWQQPEGEKHVNHPVAGRLVLGHTSFTLPDSPETLVVTYTARPGTASERALHTLLG